MEIFARSVERTLENEENPKKQKQIPGWLEFEGKAYLALSEDEVAYLVKNIQNEYLNQETYYFARDLFNRMEAFLKTYKDELAGRNSSAT